MITVAVDAMGGDNAPAEIVKGAVDAVAKRSDIKVTLVGRKSDIEQELSQYTYDKERIQIHSEIARLRRETRRWHPSAERRIRP